MNLPKSLVAFLALLLLATTTLAEQFIQVELMVETSFSNPDIGRRASRIPVKCIFGTNRWWIESGPASFRNTCYYDGTNVVNATLVTPQDVVGKRYAKRDGDHRAFVTRDTFPMGTPEVNSVWLALCSGAYLKSNNRIIPAVSQSNPEYNPLVFGYNDQTTGFPDALGLPSTIRLIPSKERFMNAHLDPRTIRRERTLSDLQRMKIEAEDGFLAAPAFSYQVEQSTNFLGWTFPTEFTFLREQAPAPAKRTPLWNRWNVMQSYRITGKVLHWEQVSEIPPPLKPGEDWMITDFRFRDPHRQMDALHYNIKDGRIPARDDPELVGQYRIQLKYQPWDPRFVADIPGIKIWSWLLVTAPSLVMVIWWRRHFSSKSQAV